MSSAATGVSAHAAGLDPTRGGLLLAEHRHVEELLEHLRVSASQGGTDIRAAWKLLAHEVEGHLAIEESELLPRFQPCEPAVAASIMVEHDAIRAAVRQVTTDVERGAAAVEPLRRLADLLSQHAEHERRHFYPWIDRRLMTWVWVRVRRATSLHRGSS